MRVDGCFCVVARVCGDEDGDDGVYLVCDVGMDTVVSVADLFTHVTHPA